MGCSVSANSTCTAFMKEVFLLQEQLVDVLQWVARASASKEYQLICSANGWPDLQVQHGDASGLGVEHILSAAAVVTLTFGGGPLVAVRVPAVCE